jgi:hypothetical protein
VNVFEVQWIGPISAPEEHNADLVVLAADDLRLHEAEGCAQHLLDIRLLVSAVVRIVDVHRLVTVDQENHRIFQRTHLFHLLSVQAEHLELLGVLLVTFRVKLAEAAIA